MDGMLSQEEINALLGGMGTTSSDDTSSPQASSSILSPEEIDTLGEISNICMGTAATTLYSLVNQKVTITTPSVTVCNWDDIAREYERPCVFINISYVEGIDGSNLLILKEDDVKVITDLMMGGDGTNLVDELSELHLSAICEAMNQMMGSSATSLSSMLDKKIDISPPEANLINLSEQDKVYKFKGFGDGQFAKVSFKMEIGELVDSSIMQLYPVDFAKDLYNTFANTESTETKKENQTEKQTTPPPMGSQPQQEVPPQMGMNPQMMQGIPYGQPMMPPYGGMPGYGNPMPPMQDINVQPVQFQTFNPGFNPLSQQENIELIMDVPLEVTVELGRTHKSIKEILDFAPGTILELDKMAGEPIDVLVNGKMVAKGEVVVIEESFGIRVTEIIKEKI